MKNFICLSAIIFLLALNDINAQVNQEWVNRFNGPGNAYDKATSVAVDGSGNVYVTGWGLTGGVNYDYATIKYNSSGIQQWAVRYNGPDNYIDQAYSVAVDNSGNVYVTGGSRGIGTERDFCTIKYNSNGDSVWVRRYNGPGNDIDEAISVVLDASGYVYVTGYSDGGINLDYCTIKYDSNGIEQWSARYGFNAAGPGTENRPHSLAVDGSGNVYVTGESNTGFGFLDMYATIKYNSSGDSVWVARYKGQGDSGLSQPNSLAVDVDGNVYVTGRSDPRSAFGFNFDVLTIKYDSSGDSLWVARYNGPGNSSDIGESIAVDREGNIFVTGISVINSTADFCTIKYSRAGDTLWIARYNGPGNSVDAATSLSLDASGNIFVTGLSTGSSSLRDYATIKYNSSGVQQWVQRYNGPGNSTDEPVSLVLDGLGSIYITGASNGLGSGSDYATIKYSQTGTPSTLQLTAFIEGFYNSALNTMVSDTVNVYLRSDQSPYIKIDSSKRILTSSGAGILNFSNAVDGVSYFFVVNHRNSIETWSKPGNIFISGSLVYDFSSAATNAFGNNQIQIDNSPLRFAIYSGDVNHDGIVDGSDQSLIDNDIFNFVTGYVNTDLTGDQITDASDAAIADNNAFNFVGKITP